MSAWYVWTAMGIYPNVPGRTELLLAAPLFTHVHIDRDHGKDITITAPQAATDVPYIQSVQVNGHPTDKPWLPESFVEHGGRLDFTLSSTPNTAWGADPKGRSSILARRRARLPRGGQPQPDCGRPG